MARHDSDPSTQQFLTKVALTDANTSYSVDLPFHIHPRIKISQEAKNTFTLRNPAGTRGALLSLDEKLPVKIINGRITPEIIGWYSKAFMHKEKTNTILGSLEIKKNIIFKTRILIKLI